MASIINEKSFLIHSNRIEDVGEEGIDDSLLAWKYIKKKNVINKRIILHVHELLMRNLPFCCVTSFCPHSPCHVKDIAGKFRKCNVRIGNRSCPDWKKIKSDILGIDHVIDTINDDYNEICRIAAVNRSECPTRHIWCKICHVGFEELHPFRDGNGRVGRILYNWQRLKLGLDIHVIKYSERWEYYKWFE